VELYLYSPNTPSWRGAQLGGVQENFYHNNLSKWGKVLANISERQ
jgi:hypothetical protein